MRRTARTLTFLVAGLLLLGIVMLASSSSVRAADRFEDPLYFAKRQLLWIALSLGMGRVLLRFDYHRWQKLAPYLAAVTVVSLVLVFVPGIGRKVGGSWRWIRLAGLSFQPSEYAKISLIILLAAWMARQGRRTREFVKGLLMPAAATGVVAGLIILEPDFGTTMVIGAVGMLVMCAGGSRLSYLGVAAALALCLFGLAVIQDPVRLGRIMAFLHPEKYPITAYHLAQSKVAFIKGGWFGVGLGNSIQKQYYLPEAHTDFILAIIGEELGLAVTLLVVVLFGGILACGTIVTLRAPELFGRLLAFGLTMLITVQAAVNIGVVTGCLPTKGLPLPFISYGGSSMMASLAAVCILLNIAEHCGPWLDEHTRPIKDRGHHL